MNFLKGYRSYLVAAGFIIAGIVKYIDGGDLMEVVRFIGEGFGLGFLRASIPAQPGAR